jgi:hypothetical protein
MEPKLNVIDEKDGKKRAKNRYLAFFIFDYIINKMCAGFLFKIIILENLTQEGH